MPTGERRDDSAMSAALTSLNESVLAMRKELSDHIASEPGEIAQAVEIATTKVINRAFPDGDPDAHCAAHREMIAVYRTRREFWQKMAFELTKLTLVGFVFWAAYQLWIAFLHGPKQ